jgi:hypothetical protein
MEMSMYIKEWGGVSMTDLPSATSASHRPDALAFYQEFYQRFTSLGVTPPKWLEDKRILANAIFRSILEPAAKSLGHLPSILAVGAGLAIAEGAWKEQGCEVVFNDCQEISLRSAQERFPNGEFLIGDIRKLPLLRQFDAISLLAFDYLFPRAELLDFVTRAGEWLKPEGQIIVYCPNTLSFRQVAAETIKRLLGRHRQSNYIHYGYWRSPAEFHRIARKAGLSATTWRFAAGDPGLRRESPLLHRWMSLKDCNLVVTMHQR